MTGWFRSHLVISYVNTISNQECRYLRPGLGVRIRCIRGSGAWNDQQLRERLWQELLVRAMEFDALGFRLQRSERIKTEGLGFEDACSSCVKDVDMGLLFFKKGSSKRGTISFTTPEP